jgi:hypothetical protein
MHYGYCTCATIRQVDQPGTTPWGACIVPSAPKWNRSRMTNLNQAQQRIESVRKLAPSQQRSRGHDVWQAVTMVIRRQYDNMTICNSQGLQMKPLFPAVQPQQLSSTIPPAGASSQPAVQPDTIRATRSIVPAHSLQPSSYSYTHPPTSLARLTPLSHPSPVQRPASPRQPASKRLSRSPIGDGANSSSSRLKRPHGMRQVPKSSDIGTRCRHSAAMVGLNDHMC